MSETRATVEVTGKVVDLIYELLDAHDDTSRLAQELLDAHDDTSRLADELGREIDWAAHLDYLQRLQRVGRELLAAGASPSE